MSLKWLHQGQPVVFVLLLLFFGIGLLFNDVITTPPSELTTLERVTGWIWMATAILLPLKFTLDVTHDIQPSNVRTGEGAE